MNISNRSGVRKDEHLVQIAGPRTAVPSNPPFI